MTLRLILVDDHEIFREGLRHILEEDGGVEVVGEAANGLEAVRLAARTKPDVVVMDIGMSLVNGIEAIRQIRRRRLGRVVVLSMYDDEETVLESFRAGAQAYVPKKSAGRELLEAISAVVRGERFLSGDLSPVLRAQVAGGLGRRRSTGRLAALSPRQRQVLQLLAEGRTSREIAAILGVAVETVKSHRKNLKRALGIRSIAELTRFAVQSGLVRQPPPLEGVHSPGRTGERGEEGWSLPETPRVGPPPG